MLIHAEHSAFHFDVMSHRAGPLSHVIPARYVDSAAFRAFKETGKLKYSEFGTQVGTARNLWNLVAGQAGFGTGGLSICTCMRSRCHAVACWLNAGREINARAVSILPFRRCNYAIQTLADIAIA